MRVLLVEDNKLNALATERMLSRLGHRMVHAESGKEALALLDQGDFDLVLLDLMMPEMDGFETARRIRESEGGRSGLPIVALTAMFGSQAQERCLKAGMDFFLTKPVDEDLFQDVVERFSPDTPPSPA